MIVHIVLFEPRADLADDERRQVFEDLRAAAAAIPSVRRCRIGRRVLHGLPGYEQAMPPYTYAAIFEFDDAAALQGYLRDPAHEAIGHHFTAAAARALAYDFEMADAAHADAAHLTRGV
ncbi:MAG TPA: Dabb family protein [Vicinamibacterales bacterium]|nr:Dabb family protein [Vicinamibacterales bacterium]